MFVCRRSCYCPSESAISVTLNATIGASGHCTSNCGRPHPDLQEDIEADAAHLERMRVQRIALANKTLRLTLIGPKCRSVERAEEIADAIADIIAYGDELLARKFTIHAAPAFTSPTSPISMSGSNHPACKRASSKINTVLTPLRREADAQALDAAATAKELRNIRNNIIHESNYKPVEPVPPMRRNRLRSSAAASRSAEEEALFVAELNQDAAEVAERDTDWKNIHRIATIAKDADAAARARSQSKAKPKRSQPRGDNKRCKGKRSRESAGVNIGNHSYDDSADGDLAVAQSIHSAPILPSPPAAREAPHAFPPHGSLPSSRRVEAEPAALRRAAVASSDTSSTLASRALSNDVLREPPRKRRRSAGESSAAPPPVALNRRSLRSKGTSASVATDAMIARQLQANDDREYQNALLSSSTSESDSGSDSTYEGD
jgi:hypothetical protein